MGGDRSPFSSPFFSWKLLVWPAIGLVVALASLYFFFRGVSFLAERDYVAALLTIFVGFALLRGGVEIARVANRNGEDR